MTRRPRTSAPLLIEHEFVAKSMEQSAKSNFPHALCSMPYATSLCASEPLCLYLTINCPLYFIKIIFLVATKSPARNV